MKGKGEREENEGGGVTGEAVGGDEDRALSQSRKSRRRRYVLSCHILLYSLSFVLHHLH